VQELLTETHQSSVIGEAATDIGRAAFKTTFNLLSNPIFSVDLADPNSDTTREFKKIVWNVMKEAKKPLVNYFPLLKKIDPQGVRRYITINFEKL
jgi:geraniol 8-hydroxylase